MNEQPDGNDTTTKAVQAARRTGPPCDWPPDKKQLLKLGLVASVAVVVRLLDAHGQPVQWARPQYARMRAGMASWDVPQLTYIGGVQFDIPDQPTQRLAFPESQWVGVGATVRIPVNFQDVAPDDERLKVAESQDQQQPERDPDDPLPIGSIHAEGEGERETTEGEGKGEVGGGGELPYGEGANSPQTDAELSASEPEAEPGNDAEASHE